MQTLFHPIPRRWVRLTIWVALVAFISIGDASWISKLGFAFWTAFFLGSYRIARLNDGWFERRMVCCFIPLKLKRWQLDRFTQIETIWQGNSDGNFEANLALLKANTGLPIQRAGR